MRPFGIRLRLLGIIFCAVLPMLALLFYGAEQTRQHEVELAAAGLRQAADLVAAQEAQVVESARQLLTAMSVTPAIRSTNGNHCFEYVDEVGALYSRYLTIARYNTSGRRDCTTGIVDTKLDGAFRRLMHPTQDQTLLIGPYTIVSDDETSELAVLPIIVSVRDSADRPLSFLAAALRLDWWAAYFGKYHHDDVMTISLIGPAGALLASGSLQSKALGVRVPWWAAIDDDQALFEFGSNLIARSSVGGSRLTVTVSRPLADILQETEQLFRLQLAVGLLALLGSASAAWLLGEWMVAARVRKLAEFVHRFKSGDFSARPPAPNAPGEFDQLEHALGQMAAKIEKQVTELSVREAQFRHEALHDPLTGLPNRRGFNEAVDLWIDELRGAADDAAIGLFIIDIDGLKLVNDTLGHAVGDAVLFATGRHLLRCLRPTDMVARLGGDEFAIAARAAPADAHVLASRLVDELSLPLRLREHQLQVGASVGVFVLEKDRLVSLDAALKQADRALYEAKRSGRGRFRMANPRLPSSPVND